MNVTPSSSARWMVRSDSASSGAAPYAPVMLIAPRPMRETSSVPRVVCFMHLSCQWVRGAGQRPGHNRGMPARPRPSTGDFPVQYVTRILFSDLDAQMHVNNIAYARWFQEGRS